MINPRLDFSTYFSAAISLSLLPLNYTSREHMSKGRRRVQNCVWLSGLRIHELITPSGHASLLPNCMQLLDS